MGSNEQTDLTGNMETDSQTESRLTAVWREWVRLDVERGGIEQKEKKEKIIK